MAFIFGHMGMTMINLDEEGGKIGIGKIVDR
jgi:hypothetical protein